MDRLTRRFSMRLAETSTRRDFLSRAARAVMGCGFSLAVLFGAEDYVFAAAGCMANKGAPGVQCSTPGKWCNSKNSDARGCAGIYKKPGDPGYDKDKPGVEQIRYCNDIAAGSCNADGTCAGAFPADKGSWQCCCNGKVTRCRDCAPNATSGPACICPSDQAGACMMP